METNLVPAAFWLVSAVTIASALAVVSVKNLVHSALYLVLTFISVAAVYVTLEADFLAAVQVLVYAGAVTILLVFGVMLTRKSGGDMSNSNPFNSYKLAGGVVSIAFVALVINILRFTVWAPDTGEALTTTVEPIAFAMLSDYVIPFEVAALLLLVALVGAILIARGVKANQ